MIIFNEIKSTLFHTNRRFASNAVSRVLGIQSKANKVEIIKGIINFFKESSALVMIRQSLSLTLIEIYFLNAIEING